MIKYGVALAFIVGALSLALVVSKAQAQLSELDEVLFTDSEDLSHAGPGPHPTTESDQFILTNGGISWPADAASVEYLIIDPPSPAQRDAAKRAVATLDRFITTRSFAHVQRSEQINPCRGQPNSISWRPGDGPGGVLAFAGVCFDVKTKAILGFRVVFDSLEAWSTTGEAGRFDLENVATHELGHVAGLEHTNAPQDGCLTMYKFSAPGEVQKRTPGLGDKLGLDKLYVTGDTAPGKCGS